MTTLPIAVALTAGLAACITDIRARRIPNWLTGSVALSGLMAHAVLPSGDGFLPSLAGLALGLLVYLPIYLLGGMGGGDVKLVAALGAWLGVPAVFWVAVNGAMAGGVLGVVVALRAAYLATLVRNLRTLFQYWWLVGPRPLGTLTLERGTGPRLAYAVPIFVGTVVTIWTR
jgi:prepilin peptidase CpaA